jgi:TIR domain-containing protein
MADYYPLIARAVAGLDRSTGENRRALYERARTALVAQLRGVTPALNESEITRERLALEEAIRKVESEAAKAAANANELKRMGERLESALRRAPSETQARHPLEREMMGLLGKPVRWEVTDGPTMPGRRKVFISYRRDDAKYQARDIYRALTRVLPRGHVFMDVDTMPLGENFVEILEDWVDQCDVVLALIGAGWITATDPKTGRPRLANSHDFVRTELRRALGRKIPVVPVVLDGAALPEPGSLPDDIRELVLRHAEFVDFRTFDADVDRLMRKLGFFEQA